ncbi:MAG: hypothetical protein DWQ44_13780 [Bacteroidetes bacterium]|nr:MAG: hypothetical protein DWQ33_08590 [Bacteroidota bacterium]REK05671.1 MAG: hypothetical protein DWQ39_04465 [Bacteroidota bacterium]REK32023.1 MAG: hypothetical protein DWQ44_13780 [Bacteroidota bacterium]REK50087.1 MAG: hypothetical protein DWQ48_06000 [Bacteroidota bacterium]
MKKKKAALLLFLSFLNFAYGQKEPTINITFSKWLANYDFIQKLSKNYPDNDSKFEFQSSKFFRQDFINLINQFDTLNIYQSYDFENYPTGQKMPVMTTSLIERNLINTTTIPQFKKQTFGIIPNEALFAFSNVLSEFEPVYDSLIYFPNKSVFEEQITKLKDYVKNSNLALYFQKGLEFYGSEWDDSIPIEIAVIPSIQKGGFKAKAFLNCAIIEIPVHFEEYDILFSVLMHEIYHTVYDGQSLEFKLNLQSWFNQNPSKNSQYAHLLLNEALATALGNGYVYEQINGTTDVSDWYNVKYINLMAKLIFPVVKEYLKYNKQIDKAFVDEYIALYDDTFSYWMNELDHILSNRYVIADNLTEIEYFNNNYRYSSYFSSQTPVVQSALERMKETPMTKVIIISSENKSKLKLVRSTFPELYKWKYKAQKEFIYTVNLQDKTKLIIINKHSTTLDKLLDDKFKNRIIE